MVDFTKTQLRALSDRWPAIEKDSTFASLEEFVDWAAETGFQTGLELYKLNVCKPHGPGNSYWYARSKPTPDVVSPFCADCQRICPVSKNGCEGYHSYYVENWDRNICRKPKEAPQAPKGREFFRYEHPDLVREGIAWQN